ncbi:outer membrane beta-barrel protein [Sphingomonas trueperi]|uniref:outer membrane beta-barrel protein n=1 Tax=Sphingomonas trueperi TaxID=53317 RepID=UPI000F15EDCF
MRLIATAVALFGAATAHAQQAPFSGTYAGVEAGVIEHHFYLDVTVNDRPYSSRYYRDTGFGGGGFAGYDLAIAPRWRIGGEVEGTVGGGSPEAVIRDDYRYGQSPRVGYRVTGRLGFVATPRLLLYGKGGYGGNRYRLTGNAGVQDAHGWSSSFVVGAGAEWRVTDHAGLRLDYTHVDNSSHQLMLGVPIRF